jgi:hypothetical protein
MDAEKGLTIPAPLTRAFSLSAKFSSSSSSNRAHRPSNEMKLLTHNMLQCNKKGCTSNNYPLALHAEEVAREESEFRPEFIKHMLAKLDYSALAFAAKAVRTLALFLCLNQIEDFTPRDKFTINRLHLAI